jgi:hypothetical protein
MIVRTLHASSSRARDQARGPVATGSTSSAPGDPPGSARRPHPARPAVRSHAIVTTPGTGPAPHGAARPARTAAAAGISEFRQHCALNGTQAPAGRDASPSPAAVTSGPDDPAHRTPDADPAASSARSRRGLPAPRSGGSRIARPGRHRARRRRPWREKAGPADVPYRQLFRTPLPPPADTGTPGTRGMRRQCPE